MLYELIAVVRTGNTTYTKDIARTVGQTILSTQGTIRNIANWGVFDLPKITVKHQAQHHKGHFFVMQFDSSAVTQQEVRRQLGLNPHMIRFSVVKIGDRLGGKAGGDMSRLEEVTGKTEWNSRKNNMLNEIGGRGGKTDSYWGF